jgi:tyrosyl-tRNA synthetase
MCISGYFWLIFLSQGGQITHQHMTPEEKHQLVTRGLQEVLGDDRLKTIMAERDLNVYWGTAPTGRPHIGYFVPMVKLADFLRAGCHVTVLFADIHAYLDNMKAPWDLLKLRSIYYEDVIKGILKSIGVPIEKLRFVKGSDFQLEKDYMLEVLRLSCMVTQHDARKAGAEVVKQVESPLLSSLIYPGMQALDEHFLGCDAQFGGVDQRKIFTFAEKYMPQLGFAKAIHLMNPMVPGLNGNKMSASDADSKIDVLEDAAAIAKKLRRAFCEEGNVENNGILAFARHVIFPVLELRSDPIFRIERPEQHGGNLDFSSYEALEAAFASKQIHPLDLKSAAAKYIDMLLAPIRAEFEASPEKMANLRAAYPEEFVTKDMAKLKVSDAKKVEKVVRFDAFDIRVGRVLSVEKHPDADSLYIESVDLGEESGPRTIVSGLVKYMAPEAIQGRLVTVLCNLKPATMRGVQSNGMLMCASTETAVELLCPPEGSKPGERISLEDAAALEPAEAQIDGKKKDAALMAAILADLKTDAEATASFKGVKLVSSAGPVRATSLVNANIS